MEANGGSVTPSTDGLYPGHTKPLHVEISFEDTHHPLYRSWNPTTRAWTAEEQKPNGEFVPLPEAIALRRWTSGEDQRVVNANLSPPSTAPPHLKEVEFTQAPIEPDAIGSIPGGSPQPNGPGVAARTNAGETDAARDQRQAVPVPDSPFAHEPFPEEEVRPAIASSNQTREANGVAGVDEFGLPILTGGDQPPEWVTALGSGPLLKAAQLSTSNQDQRVIPNSNIVGKSKRADSVIQWIGTDANLSPPSTAPPHLKEVEFTQAPIEPDAIGSIPGGSPQPNGPGVAARTNAGETDAANTGKPKITRPLHLLPEGTPSPMPGTSELVTYRNSKGAVITLPETISITSMGLDPSEWIKEKLSVASAPIPSGGQGAVPEDLQVQAEEYRYRAAFDAAVQVVAKQRNGFEGVSGNALTRTLYRLTRRLGNRGKDLANHVFANEAAVARRNGVLVYYREALDDVVAGKKLSKTEATAYRFDQLDAFEEAVDQARVALAERAPVGVQQDRTLVGFILSSSLGRAVRGAVVGGVVAIAASAEQVNPAARYAIEGGTAFATGVAEYLGREVGARREARNTVRGRLEESLRSGGEQANINIVREYVRAMLGFADMIRRGEVPDVSAAIEYATQEYIRRNRQAVRDQLDGSQDARRRENLRAAAVVAAGALSSAAVVEGLNLLQHLHQGMVAQQHAPHTTSPKPVAKPTQKPGTAGEGIGSGITSAPTRIPSKALNTLPANAAHYLDPKNPMNPVNWAVNHSGDHYRLVNVPNGTKQVYIHTAHGWRALNSKDEYRVFNQFMDKVWPKH